MNGGCFGHVFLPCARTFRSYTVCCATAALDIRADGTSGVVTVVVVEEVEEAVCGMRISGYRVAKRVVETIDEWMACLHIVTVKCRK